VLHGEDIVLQDVANLIQNPERQVSPLRNLLTRMWITLLVLYGKLIYICVVVINQTTLNKMIKSKESQSVSVDLTGPEGNAFVLLGYANKWSKQLGLNPDEVEKEMMSGDYENLVSVLEKHFGSVVTFYR